LLSGSANLGLLAGVSESLAGRAVYLTLHPLTRRECHGKIADPLEIERFFESGRWPSHEPADPVSAQELLRGGLPPVALGQVHDRALWFTGFEQTYLERDVRHLAQVTDLIGFRRLLKLAALRTGQLLNHSNLARDAHLSVVTAGRYLSLLEASFVVTRLPPYLANRASRLIKSPKVFVSDAGLACHLTGVEDLGPSWADPLKGSIIETYVLQNLSGMIAARWPRAKLSFWRIQGRHEVDVVIELGRETLAVEVKASSRWEERDLGGLRAFLAATARCRAGLLAYNGAATVKLGERLWAVPLARLVA
jgi:predicted AAA+ superfamily ATPase